MLRGRSESHLLVIASIPARLALHPPLTTVQGFGLRPAGLACVLGEFGLHDGLRLICV